MSAALLPTAGSGVGGALAAYSALAAATLAATAAVDAAQPDEVRSCPPARSSAPPFSDLRCEELRQGSGFACTRRRGGMPLGQGAHGRCMLPKRWQPTTHLTARWVHAR